jgi:hypothetical protein
VSSPVPLEGARRGGWGRTEAEFWEFEQPMLAVLTSNDAQEGAAAFGEAAPTESAGNLTARTSARPTARGQASRTVTTGAT